MQLEELDRLLSQQDNISPSSRFTASVMSRVLREAQIPRGIGFPWTPVVFGIASAAVAVGAGLAFDTSGPVFTAQSSAMTGWLESWTAYVSAAAVSPTVSALALALVVTLVPMAVYEGYQRVHSGPRD